MLEHIEARVFKVLDEASVIVEQTINSPHRDYGRKAECLSFLATMKNFNFLKAHLPSYEELREKVCELLFLKMR
jgi:hypothetical protein